MVTAVFGQVDLKTTEKNAKPAVMATCPAAKEVQAAHLYGLWRVQFQAPSNSGNRLDNAKVLNATVLMEKNPELADSLAGGINRNGVRSQIAGDVNQATFTLEESDNGQDISATWNGGVVEGSCGAVIEGTWTQTQGGATQGFVLRHLPGW